ncbi:hypothetical protein GGTG_06965 [Gaeumannomyces tritici R3-111a-1]|uniref:Uncharacterized protein n=1 Tax=Gaeumannomyces tritici (strain R3-111a-1) TaxID=644352 RepID=J3P0B8_GAET3|nr:hypothetical protein GGTG_06965 [Gaeumannomyces tritici R3-111a-1]EJT77051.1 hypothetical protein GGTG_06965 [Gaeumannomyces tritici R3-111a-1]
MDDNDIKPADNKPNQTKPKLPQAPKHDTAASFDLFGGLFTVRLLSPQFQPPPLQVSRSDQWHRQALASFRRPTPRGGDPGGQAHVSPVPTLHATVSFKRVRACTRVGGLPKTSQLGSTPRRDALALQRHWPTAAEGGVCVVGGGSDKLRDVGWRLWGASHTRPSRLPPPSSAFPPTLLRSAGPSMPAHRHRSRNRMSSPPALPVLRPITNPVEIPAAPSRSVPR